MLSRHGHISPQRSLMSRRAVLGMAISTAGLAVLAACGGSATATPVTSAATTAGAAATAVPATTPASTAPASGSAASNATLPTATSGAAAGATTPAGSASAATNTQKVNANTASQDQIAQVLQANGVPSATRWAGEVVEYRPYPTNDPTFAKLRSNLAKYNPSPDVVEKIVASLSL
jgi:hypothetical protein